MESPVHGGSHVPRVPEGPVFPLTRHLRAAAQGTALSMCPASPPLLLRTPSSPAGQGPRPVGPMGWLSRGGGQPSLLPGALPPPGLQLPAWPCGGGAELGRKAEGAPRPGDRSREAQPTPSDSGDSRLGLGCQVPDR